MQLLKTAENEFDEKIEQFQDSIFLNVGPCIKKISLKSIQYVEGYGDYMKISCDDGNHTVYIRMKTLEEILPTSDFFRVHRSFLIRMDRIDSIHLKALKIKERFIPISRDRKEQLMNRVPWVK